MILATCVMRIWNEYFSDVKIEKCICCNPDAEMNIGIVMLPTLQVVSCLLLPKFYDQLVTIFG